MKKNHKLYFILIASTFYLNFSLYANEHTTIVREAMSTITPVEMNIGDILEYALSNWKKRMPRF